MSSPYPGDAHGDDANNANNANNTNSAAGNGGQQPYGSQQSYGNQQPYGSQQPYGNQQPYGSQQPYGNQQPYGAQQPYGNQQMSPYQGQPLVPTAPKSQVAAALLAFFLGGFGAHNFYLGYNKRAIAQLITLVVSFITVIFIIGIVGLVALGIWVFVEFIMILAKAGGYDRDANGVPLQ